MTLRSTPRNTSRDNALFPALAQTYQKIGTPYRFTVKLWRSYAFIVVDGFYIEEPLQENLAALHTQYVHWWGWTETPLRFPRPGIIHQNFHDLVNLLVPRMHAQWWIDLLNETAPFLVDPWPFPYRPANFG